MGLDIKMFKAACEEWLKGRQGEDELLNAARETNPDAVTVLMANKETGETFCFLCSSMSDAESYEKSDKNIRNVGKIFEMEKRNNPQPPTFWDVYNSYLGHCTLEKLLGVDERDKGGK